MTETALRMSRDFVRDRKASFLLWWFPALLMIATGPLALGSYGWAWIGGITLVGAFALTILPERIWGQYSGGDGEPDGDGAHCGLNDRGTCL